VQQVLPVIDASHFLFPDDADPAQPYALGGVPSDQVQGADTFHDRWYLARVRTNTYDEIRFPNGTTEYNWAHNDIFAYRTDPANRANLLIVRLTNWYGNLLLHYNDVPEWSNDSNEALDAEGRPTSYVGGLYARDISARFELALREDGSEYSIVHMDWVQAPLVGKRLPVTASQIETASRLGISDISDLIEPYSLAIPEGLPMVSPDGSLYAESQNRVVTLKHCLDRSAVRILWDGTLGQPESPANFVFSRNGAWLAFINAGWNEYSSSGGVWTMPITGGATPIQLIKNVQKGAKSQHYQPASWSPDSQYLLVNWSFFDGSVTSKEALYVLPATGGAPLNVTPNATGFVRGARWVSNTPSPVSP
jgi:hypothetical protein